MPSVWFYNKLANDFTLFCSPLQCIRIPVAPHPHLLVMMSAFSFWWVCNGTSFVLSVAFPSWLLYWAFFCVHISHSYSFYEVSVQIICIYLFNWLALLNCKFSLNTLDKNLLSYSYVHYECFPSVSGFLFCFLKCQREDVFKFDEVQLSVVFSSYNLC